MKTISHYIIIYLAITSVLPLSAEIKSRTLPDGSVEFYNDQFYNKSGIPQTRYPSRTLPKTPYDSLIAITAEDNNIDPKLIKCMIKIESDFNPDATSPAGAMGLMQLMPDTAKIYRLENPYDPLSNIQAGTKHFRALLDHFKGDIPLALAAYNAGSGRVSCTGKVPEITETVHYVNKIMYLYCGKKDYIETVKKLYKQYDQNGVLNIYN